MLNLANTKFHGNPLDGSRVLFRVQDDGANLCGLHVTTNWTHGQSCDIAHGTADAVVTCTAGLHKL